MSECLCIKRVRVVSCISNMAFLQRVLEHLVKLLSSREIIAFFVNVAEHLAAQTDNELDDQLVCLLKKSLKVDGVSLDVPAHERKEA